MSKEGRSLISLFDTIVSIKVLRHIGSKKPYSTYLWRMTLDLDHSLNAICRTVKVLRDDGLIQSKKAGSKKYFALTEKGAVVYKLFQDLLRSLK